MMINFINIHDETAGDSQYYPHNNGRRQCRIEDGMGEHTGINSTILN